MIRNIILDLEKNFVKNSGILLGATKYLSEADQNNLIVMLASDEALNILLQHEELLK